MYIIIFFPIFKKGITFEQIDARSLSYSYSFFDQVYNSLFLYLFIVDY